jgi:fatty acid desaturase
VSARVYTALFYPHGGRPRPNPLVLLHFLPYVLKQTLGALFPAGPVALLIPAPCPFSRGQRLRIAGELLLIAGFQYGLFVLAGRGIAYVFVGPLAVAWASVFIMLYVFTNHFANAVLDRADPLAGTTSVIVSPLLDWLHLNFSFHTEHHLFPAMDSRFLPLVSRLLQEHFPARYQRVPIAVAWRRAWQRAAFAEVEACPPGPRE